jgi:hypothetical protein
MAAPRAGDVAFVFRNLRIAPNAGDVQRLLRGVQLTPSEVDGTIVPNLRDVAWLFPCGRSPRAAARRI